MINHRGLLDGWLVVELNDAVHVVPNNDVRFHMVTQGMGCACEPELWRGGDGTPVVVHNSFDGRKLVEPLTTILS